ncbi:MAG: N-acyl-D-glucosamine 2-epimerase [Chitinophagaceae bacterium]|nr:MAG: N-acyl-D-glucosamine 2-epimerase [Chitinophagaceae bacterium]
MDTQSFYNEVSGELDSILRYWMKHTPDKLHGGFVGRIDHHDFIYPDAPKGVVLNARILWSFSAAHNLRTNPEYLGFAERAFDYIAEHFIDGVFGGAYWMVDAEGSPLNTKKQVYAQAFVIYACSEYFIASGDGRARDLAVELYYLLQRHSYDSRLGGYFEAFTRDWKLLGDARLSEKDENEVKTMNTHLHILEAYSTLYKIWPDDGLAGHIRGLLKDFPDHMVDKHTGHLKLFFSEDWTVKGNTLSFGHDIEASWLLLEAAENLHDQELTNEFLSMALQMAVAASRGLDIDGGLWYESGDAGQKLVTEKHWWPQAEALVGFVNAWQISNDVAWLEKAMHTWEFIKNHIIDLRSGEWVWGVDQDYQVLSSEDKVGVWKCPYHNARACIEIINRLGNTAIFPGGNGLNTSVDKSREV